MSTIRIISCGQSIWWYKDHIGKEFENAELTEGKHDWRVRDEDGQLQFVWVKDAQVIDQPTKTQNSMKIIRMNAGGKKGALLQLSTEEGDETYFYAILPNGNVTAIRRSDATLVVDTEKFIPVEAIEAIRDLLQRDFNRSPDLQTQAQLDIVKRILRQEPKPIPFTIGNYQNLVLKEKTHEVRTVGDYRVDILSTTVPDNRWQVVGTIEFVAGNKVGVGAWNFQGKSDNNDGFNLLLYPIAQPLPEEKPVIGYINVYETPEGYYRSPHNVLYENKQEADENQLSDSSRIACATVRLGDGL